jgi:hypothetical protein
MLSPSGDISVRDVLLAEIRDLGPDKLYAASLGWRLGVLDGEMNERRKIGRAGAEVGSSPEWRATRRQPCWVELQRRRGECAHKHRPDRCTCPGGAA